MTEQEMKFFRHECNKALNYGFIAGAFAGSFSGFVLGLCLNIAKFGWCSF